MTMQHRFKMPPGGSARDCWENPVNCRRIAPAIIESKRGIARYLLMRAAAKHNPPTAATGRFPYPHRSQRLVRIDETLGTSCYG